jgi:hypothetical protein
VGNLKEVVRKQLLSSLIKLKISKFKFANLRIDEGKMSESSWDYLIKFNLLFAYRMYSTCMAKWTRRKPD